MLLCGNCDSMDFEEFGSWGEKKFSCCRDSERSHLQKMAFEALYKDSKYPSHGVITRAGLHPLLVSVLHITGELIDTVNLVSLSLIS